MNKPSHKLLSVRENTAEYWLEMIIEHSYDQEMTSLEFGQTARLLVDRLNAMIDADKAIDAARKVEA